MFYYILLHSLNFKFTQGTFSCSLIHSFMYLSYPVMYSHSLINVHKISCHVLSYSFIYVLKIKISFRVLLFIHKCPQNILSSTLIHAFMYSSFHVLKISCHVLSFIHLCKIFPKLRILISNIS